MKRISSRILTLVLALVMITSVIIGIPGRSVGTALDLIPHQAMWGMSRAELEKAIQSTEPLALVKVAKRNAVRVIDCECEGYELDAYYLLSKAVGSHYGLGSVTYILDKDEDHSDEGLQKAYDTLVAALQESLGDWQEESGKSTTWMTDDCKIKIGIGNCEKFTGSSERDLAVQVFGLKFPEVTRRPTATPRPTRTPKPTKTPKPT